MDKTEQTTYLISELLDVDFLEDVKYHAEQEGVEITDEQCSQVLLHVLRHHDASVGVSWDTISASIDRVLQIERRVSKKTGKCV